MTTYACFVIARNPNGKGVWYQLTDEFLPDGAGHKNFQQAYMIWPNASNDKVPVVSQDDAPSNNWIRTDYDESEVPDWLWVHLAKSTLLNERKT